MKTFVLATAIVFGATTAMAGNFDANELVTTFKSGKMELSLGAVDGKLNTVSTSVTDIAAYNLGRFDASLDLGLTYGRLDETLGVAATYNVSTALSPLANLYGSAELAYIAPTAKLSDGDVFATPTLGASYKVTDSVTAFGEVSYTWNASNKWAKTGGALELGADIFVADKVSIAPSLVRTFDTGSDSTNLKLEATFRF